MYQQTQRWLKAGCFEAMANDLRALLRLAAGREPTPTAAIFDSRTLQSTPESGAHAGYLCRIREPALFESAYVEICKYWIIPSASIRDSPMRDQQGDTEFVVGPAESVACYAKEIPPFVKAELERLYGQVRSSLPFFEIFRSTENVCTYVAKDDGRPSAILIFVNRGRKIEVLNEMIRLGEREIRRFADYVFTRFPLVAVISFKAIQADLRALPFPYQCHNSKEDFVITLPDTPEEYLSLVGPSTRSNLKRYLKKIAKDYPTFKYQVYVNEEINEEDVRELIRLSEKRIFAKKKRFGIDEEEARRIVRLAKTCGLVGVVSIDGRLCAGTLAHRSGTSYMVTVTAHDTTYDSYWLGALCYYLTVCESIMRGARRFHMGEGRYKYKSRLLGVRQDMDRIEIYRSYAHAILNSATVVKAIFYSWRRRAILWILEREQSRISQFVFSTLLVFRKLKEHVARSRQKA